MKKLLLQILFLLLVLPAMTQNFVSISGVVTDIATGSPIANQAVTITSDSTGGWFYSNTVYTYSNGFYVDTIPVPLNTQGVLYVNTIDCQNYLHQVVITFMPSLLNFTVDFSICHLNNPCQAYFTAQQQQPLTVEFLDASVGGGNTRLWDFGDGSTSTQQNPTHTYAQSGSFNVTLTIGALGTICYNSVIQNIYVWDSTAGGGCHAAFAIVPDNLNMPPYTYNFYSQSTGNNIVSYTWNFGDGNFQTITFPQNPDVTHTYAQPGPYVACLTIQGADSTCWDTSCDTLFVGTGGGCHAAFVAVPDSMNTSQSYQFFDQSTGALASWTWDFGDGSPLVVIYSPANPNVNHTYSQSGNYVVCLTIQGTDSTCYDVSCQPIVVGPGPGCQANFSYAVDPAIGGRTIVFTDVSTGDPSTWQWNFGDGTSSNLQNPVHTFAGTAPVFTVCLTIGGNNCTSTICKDIVIQDTLNYHQVYGQVFAGNFPISMGLVMIFSLDTNANYQPFVNVASLDSNGVYFFTMVPDGNYYILAIPFDSNGYLPTYYGNTIIWENATLIPLGTENNPYNINMVQSYQMTPGPGSANGQINMGDVHSSMVDKINMILRNDEGNAIGFTTVSTSGAFVFPTLAYGTYYLHPEMPGVTSDYIMVTITPEKPHADVVMTFSGNRILGVRDEVTLINRWSAYPNPFIDNLTLTIDMKQGTIAEISIYNMTGQMVLSSRVTLHDGTNNIGVSTASLPSGVYTLRLHSNAGLILQSKLVKTR